MCEANLQLDFAGRRLQGRGFRLRFEVHSNGWSISGEKTRQGDGLPFAQLRELLQEANERWPRGAAIGYAAYELAQHIEPRALAVNRAAELTYPLLRLDFFEELVEDTSPTSAVAAPTLLTVADELESRNFYQDGVRRIKEYIAAGDIYQANLTWRFHRQTPYSPGELYERLRALGEAPQAALLEWPDFAVISNSPEKFLTLHDGVLTASPIKGTIQRGATPEQDAALVATLQASIKDRAENVMIVDLLRNDLGRVCDYGSVHVPELFEVHTFPTLHHLISTVQGRIKPEYSTLDAFLAAFPCGSITGAPKIRSMQILSEMEPVLRGVAMGAIGYFGFNGDMEWNVAIRTATQIGNDLYFHAGGGIVADSVPELEYDEMRLKARALWSASAR